MYLPIAEIKIQFILSQRPTIKKRWLSGMSIAIYTAYTASLILISLVLMPPTSLYSAESLSRFTRNGLLLMRGKGHWAVCLEEAGSPRPTQSLTWALYLNQASGTQLHLLSTSWLLISFCVTLFVSLCRLGFVVGVVWGVGVDWPKKDGESMQFFSPPWPRHRKSCTKATTMQTLYLIRLHNTQKKQIKALWVVLVTAVWVMTSTLSLLTSQLMFFVN